MGERFDTICCNPPLLPIPDELSYPIVGDGGPDGLALTKPILQRLPDLLTAQGRCLMVGTVTGNDNGPYLTPFQRIAESQRLDIQLIIPCREPVTERSPLLSNLVATISAFNQQDIHEVEAKLLAFYESEHVKYIYSFLLAATLASPAQSGQVTWTTHYLRNATFWTV